jgi:hypothetical protein
MRRRTLALVGFFTGLFAVTAFIRRGTTRRRERADLYFADGSMVSLPSDSAEAQRLLPLARDLLRAARSD